MVKIKVAALCVLSFTINAAWAVYISPVEYKHHNCEELQEEFTGWWEEYKNADSKYYDYMIEHGDSPHRKLQDQIDMQQETADARMKAIKKAAIKSECTVTKKNKE